MSLLQIYLRVLALLAPERWLATALAAANVALAAVFLLEPWLFGRRGRRPGRRRDRAMPGATSPGGPASASSAWPPMSWWRSTRTAWRTAGASPPWSTSSSTRSPCRSRFHDRQHTGRLLRTLHTGSSNLFHLWLAFFRSHLSTLIALLVMVPLSLRVNGKLALLMMVLMGDLYPLQHHRGAPHRPGPALGGAAQPGDLRARRRRVRQRHGGAELRARPDRGRRPAGRSPRRCSPHSTRCCAAGPGCPSPTAPPAPSRWSACSCSACSCTAAARSASAPSSASSASRS